MYLNVHIYISPWYKMCWEIDFYRARRLQSYLQQCVATIRDVYMGISYSTLNSTLLPICEDAAVFFVCGAPDASAGAVKLNTGKFVFCSASKCHGALRIASFPSYIQCMQLYIHCNYIMYNIIYYNIQNMLHTYTIHLTP